MKVTTQPQSVAMAPSGLLALISRSKEIANQSSIPPKKYQHLDYITNSYLSMLDRELTGTQQFFGNEKYLIFGNELHKRWLEPKEKKRKLSAEEEVLLKSMLKRLNEDKEIMAYYNKAVKETITVEPVYGAHVKVTLDLKNKRTRSAKDLKTTSATSQAEFFRAALEYNYFKQAALYMMAEDLDEFEFIGISKKGKHEIFLIDVNDYPEHLEAGREKARGLIQIHTSIKQYINEHLHIKQAA